jgi:hypothetical protein
MSTFRICGCCLLFLALLSTLGCSLVKGFIESFASPVQVTINADCSVHPDTQTVYIDRKLKWTPPDPNHSYVAHFPPTKTPFYYSSVSDVPAGHAQKVTGDTQCDAHNSSACDFPYVVFKDGQKCGDPIIHVTPN